MTSGGTYYFPFKKGLKKLINEDPPSSLDGSGKSNSLYCNLYRQCLKACKGWSPEEELYAKTMENYAVFLRPSLRDSLPKQNGLPISKMIKIAFKFKLSMDTPEMRKWCVQAGFAFLKRTQKQQDERRILSGWAKITAPTFTSLDACILVSYIREYHKFHHLKRSVNAINRHRSLSYLPSPAASFGSSNIGKTENLPQKQKEPTQPHRSQWPSSPSLSSSNPLTSDITTPSSSFSQSPPSDSRRENGTKSRDLGLCRACGSPLSHYPFKSSPSYSNSATSDNPYTFCSSCTIRSLPLTDRPESITTTYPSGMLKTETISSLSLSSAASSFSPLTYYTFSEQSQSRSVDKSFIKAKKDEFHSKIDEFSPFPTGKTIDESVEEGFDLLDCSHSKDNLDSSEFPSLNAFSEVILIQMENYLERCRSAIPSKELRRPDRHCKMIVHSVIEMVRWELNLVAISDIYEADFGSINEALKAKAGSEHVVGAIVTHILRSFGIKATQFCHLDLPLLCIYSPHHREKLYFCVDLAKTVIYGPNEVREYLSRISSKCPIRLGVQLLHDSERISSQALSLLYYMQMDPDISQEESKFYDRAIEFISLITGMPPSQQRQNSRQETE